MFFAQNILDMLLTVFVALVVGAMCIFVVRYLLRVLRPASAQQHTLQLENRGNCRSIYYIAVQAADPNLNFELRYGGTPLVEAPLMDEIIEEVSEEAPQAAPDLAQPVGGAPAQSQKPAKKPADISGATKKAQAAAGKVGILSSLLSALGALLPGSLGAGFRQQAGTLRGVQTDATKVIRTPQTVQTQVGAVKTESARLSGGAAAQRQPVKGASKTAALSSSVAVQTVSPAAFSSVTTTNIKQVVRPDQPYRAQTPEIGAGEVLALTLRIDRVHRPFAAGSVAYAVQSEQVALDFPEAIAEPLTRHAVAHFAPVSIWRRALRWLAALLVILASVIVFLYVYLLIWL
jgi:hypothetical protein